MDDDGGRGGFAEEGDAEGAAVVGVGAGSECVVEELMIPVAVVFLDKYVAE